jgi:hypothetical protein
MEKSLTRVCFCDLDSLICFDAFDSCTLFCPELDFAVTFEVSQLGIGTNGQGVDNDCSARGFLDVTK